MFPIHVTPHLVHADFVCIPGQTPAEILLPQPSMAGLTGVCSHSCLSIAGFQGTRPSVSYKNTAQSLWEEIGGEAPRTISALVRADLRSSSSVQPAVLVCAVSLVWCGRCVHSPTSDFTSGPANSDFLLQGGRGCPTLFA